MLRDVLDDDLAAKRVRTEGTDSDVGQRSRRSVQHAVIHGLTFSPDEPPEISHQCHRNDLTTHEKENIVPAYLLEGHLDDAPDPIHQEDGYMSPSSPYFRLATPDLSSPVRDPYEVTPRKHGSTDDFGSDIISSPLAIKQRSEKRSALPRECAKSGKILVRGTPPLIETDIGGPDLRDMLSVCSGDEVEELEDHENSGPERVSANTTTPKDNASATRACDMRMHAVANGWWNKWAMKQDPRSAPVSNLIVGPSDAEF